MRKKHKDVFLLGEKLKHVLPACFWWSLWRGEVCGCVDYGEQVV